MREIKFRAWEPLNGIMHTLDFCLYQFNDGGQNSHKFVLPTGRQGMQNPYTFMNLEAVKVMQYTGLKDKNGVEIYEGDIYENHQGALFKIQYEQQEAAYLGVSLNRAYGAYGGISLINLSGTSKGSVIGNIYENPELLEESK